MRGLRIGVLYELKDKLSGGLNRIKERMGQVNELQQRARMKSKEYFDSFSKGVKEASPSLEKFKLKNMELFDAIQDQVPFLGRLGGLLSNPYVIAIAGVVALGTATVKLGQEMFRVSEQIELNQKTVKSTFDITGRELDSTTAKVMALSKIMNIEVKELSLAANAMHREYKDAGVGIEDSLNNIKLGLIATNGTLDLQEIKEYASQMKSAGVSAEGLTSILVMSKKEGVFSDKAIDAVKEFSLRLKEMTPMAAQALQGIGLSSDEILKQLDSGEKRVFDVLRDVSAAMANVNTQARQTAIADLFGGPGEDLGERMLLKFKDMSLNLKDMVDTSDTMIARQEKRLKLEEKIAKVQGDSAGFFNGLRHSFEDFIGWAKLDLFDTMSRLFGSDTRSLRLFEEQSQLVKQLTQNLNPLLTEMEMLQGKTSLSATEQERLRDVMQQIAGLTPNAVTKWDQYGNAIEISTGKAKEFLALQKEILLQRNKDAIEGLRGTIAQEEKRKLFEMADLKAGGKWVSLRNSSVFDALEPTEIEGLNKSILSRNIKIADALQQLEQLGVEMTPENIAFLKEVNKKISGESSVSSGNAENPDGTATPDGSGGSSISAMVGNAVQQKSLTVHIQNLNEGGITVNTKNLKEGGTEVEEKFTEMLINAIRNMERGVGQ
jgi:hypothetical protein